MINKVIGEVISGGRVGRELGFPTANIMIAPSLQVKDGVWAGTVTTDGLTYPSVINIGYSPTVGERPRRLEAHLLGFDGDLYGKTIEVRLLRFLRGEEKFTSLDALREQIERDKAGAEAYFRENPAEIT